MSTKIFIDRSRIETYQRCNRKRLIEYHLSGTGIQPAKRNIYLAVGGSVHAGLATLLREGQKLLDTREHVQVGQWEARWWDSSIIEDEAVAAALLDFAQYSGALELDSTEIAAMTAQDQQVQWDKDLIAQAQELGMSTEGLNFDRAATMRQFDSMLYDEQAALVEGMVRAYARYRLRPLLEEFEVLEVEREGEWMLGEYYHNWIEGDDERERCSYCGIDKIDLLKREREYGAQAAAICYALWFMSRPDALLRHRQTNQLHLLSFKTTGSWGDIRRLKAAEHDVQGLTEGVEVERRLARWWDAVKQRLTSDGSYWADEGKIPMEMARFLDSCAEPPRIYAIRYEYLLKGERREDKELSQRLGMTVRTQRSHLIQQYVAISTPQKGASGYSLGDVCWSWDFIRPEDDKDSKLAWQNWKSFPVYREGGGVKAWIDKLAASEILMSGEDSTVGMEPRQLGWKSEAQKMGVTRKHPFEEVFPPPVIVIRQDDELRDVFEQIEAQERRVAEDVARINSNGVEDSPRSVLNQLFPQHRHSCFYPTECWATRICYATDAAVQADPLGAGGGKFVRRVPNHPMESQGK